MSNGSNIIGNPLMIAVGLLAASYVIGEFIISKYPLIYAFNLIGILGLILSTFVFISGFNMFKSYDENPLPSSTTDRIIKTGIFAYTRNPIYLSIIMFFLSMFLVFENVMYFLSAVGLTIWLHNYVIKSEENFLINKFPGEYDLYMKAVKRWIFF
jgi:protein-S-isoprenylcysteine O-methyltransferase Ste14